MRVRVWRQNARARGVVIGPHHRNRVPFRITVPRIDHLRSFWRLLSGHGGRSRRSRRKRCDVVRHLCGILLDYALQTTQVPRFGFDRECWTYLAGPPRARKTGDKCRKIRWLGSCAGKLSTISRASPDATERRVSPPGASADPRRWRPRAA